MPPGSSSSGPHSSDILESYEPVQNLHNLSSIDGQRQLDDFECSVLARAPYKNRTDQMLTQSTTRTMPPLQVHQQTTQCIRAERQIEDGLLPRA